MSGGATLFSPGLTLTMWNGPLANQGGYVLGISAAGDPQRRLRRRHQRREASHQVRRQHAELAAGRAQHQLGRHLHAGRRVAVTETRAPITHASAWPTGDPASATCSRAANFPGSSTAERNAAQDLYAMLTGRVSSIAGTARLDASTGKYVYNGASRQEGRLREWRLLHPGQLEGQAEPLAERRPPLRVSSSRSTRSTAVLDGDARRHRGAAPATSRGCDPSAPTPETCNLFKHGVRCTARSRPT